MTELSKRQFLLRARALIEEGTDHALRYAALELRCCIEALTYEKLMASHSLLSSEALSTWQAPQAVRYLLEMDPGGDKDFTIAMGIEDVPGQPAKEMQLVGQHRSLNATWVRKHYNKLGSYLHAPHPSAPGARRVPTVEYLKEVVNELDRVCAGTITGGWMAEVYEFQCMICSNTIVCTDHKASSGTTLVCHHPNCDAEYLPRKESDTTYAFHLVQTLFDCAACKSQIPVLNKRLRLGLVFVCPECGKRNKLYERHWAYGLENLSGDEG